MKVFISSVISGFEAIRAACADAIETLGHAPLKAEDFGARAGSPQVACLGAVREADLVVLLLGTRYGASQQSGLSATHEEYQEAKRHCPVLAFVQQGVDREPAQAAFVDEVQGWASGHYTQGFREADDLRRAVTRAIRDHEVSRAVAPLDSEALVRRAASLLQVERHDHQPLLALAVVPGPTRSVLRPTEIEDPRLAEDLQKEALFGAARLFTAQFGCTAALRDRGLVLEQKGATLTLGEEGDIVLASGPRRPAPAPHARRPGGEAHRVLPRVAHPARASGQPEHGAGRPSGQRAAPARAPRAPSPTEAGLAARGQRDRRRPAHPASPSVAPMSRATFRRVRRGRNRRAAARRRARVKGEAASSGLALQRAPVGPHLG